MGADTVATFFTILLLLGGALLAASLMIPELHRAVRSAAPQLAAAIAVGATAGSLYFSEVAGFVPCELCWFQRIAMYPLALIAVGAAIRGDRSSRLYTIALSMAGLLIALYHVQLQAFPSQQSFCDVTQPCTDSPVKAFDLVTIPQMSALSFAGIAVLTVLSRQPDPTEGTPDEQQAQRAAAP